MPVAWATPVLFFKRTAKLAAAALLTAFFGAPAHAFDTLSIWRAQGVELGDDGFPLAWSRDTPEQEVASETQAPPESDDPGDAPGSGTGQRPLVYSPADQNYLLSGDAGGTPQADLGFLGEYTFAGMVQQSFESNQTAFWQGVMQNFWGLTPDPGGNSQNPDVVNGSSGILLDNGLIVGAGNASNGSGRTLVCFTEIMGVCTQFGFSD